MSPFSGDSSLLEGTPPQKKDGSLILGQHYSDSTVATGYNRIAFHAWPGCSDGGQVGVLGWVR